MFDTYIEVRMKTYVTEYTWRVDADRVANASKVVEEIINLLAEAANKTAE